VLEIGPGLGTLTSALFKFFDKVISVELDDRLAANLPKSFPGKNLQVVHDDVLKLDIDTLDLPEKYVVAGNIPYYITSPIIDKFLHVKHKPQKIVFLVQKEVADRMQVGPGTKDYGALSLAVQYYAEPYIVANVPQNCFIPRPNVGSAVIRLTRHKEKPVTVKNEQHMFRLVRAAFNQRRKTLQNALHNMPELNLSKEQVVNALKEMGLSETIRGEKLTLEEFAKLSDLLTK
jgi:16S rRNA (adenine1518-N6/adenine1519-N6)-dimethyltransferase